MAKRKSSTQQIRNPSNLVPRHVANLNALAEKCGFKTSVRVGKAPKEWPVDKCDDDGDGDFTWARGDVVLSTWSGTKAQLLSMGLLAPSYRVPLNYGWICEPRYGPWIVERKRPVLCGFIKVSGDNVFLELYGGPRPISVRMAGAVEIVEYADAVLHHGTRDALIAERICTAAGLSRKRTLCSSTLNDSPWHVTRRQPDGTFVHWLETEDARRRRIAAERQDDAQQETTTKENSQCRTDYQSPDEFREYREDIIVLSMRLFLSAASTTTETRNGYRYRLDPAGVAHVLNAIETAAQGLRTVPVTVAKLVDPAQKKAARDQAASAAVDGAFQRFIGRTIGTLPDAAAGA